MSEIRGTNVLVTGGANGIGKLMGLKCLQEGAANLVIWDINEENLHKTQKEFSFDILTDHAEHFDFVIKGSTNFFRALAFATVVVILLCFIKEDAILDNIAAL